jgi:predicted transcriptional regulator
VPPAGPASPHAAGPTDVPTLAVAREDLEWFDLSPSARELLLHINGHDAVDTLAERAQSPVTEVLRELARLADEGLVTWR